MAAWNKFCLFHTKVDDLPGCCLCANHVVDSAGCFCGAGAEKYMHRSCCAGNWNPIALCEHFTPKE